jgi:predicted Fe-Mo cluster-binding NifX family protein
MKIGFTAKGTEWRSKIDARFGRARYLLVYDEAGDELTAIDNMANSTKAHGAGPGTAKKLFDMQTDILITGNGPGENAAMILLKAGIKVYTGADGMTIRQAYDHYTKRNLKQFNLKR